MSLQRYLISLTRPARYAVESLSYRMFGDTTKLAELRNSNQGKPMLVVGNGPSLNRTPLDEFAGVPSIGMNKIDMIFPRTAWRPTLIVCLNNIVAQQHQDSFAASEIPVLVAWKARRLIRSGNRQRLTYFETKSKNAFSTDLMRGFGGSATVTYIALQLAYWSGADPVVLLGVDHSFKFSGPRATYQKRSGPDENHFDPNYFKSGTVWVRRTLCKVRLITSLRETLSSRVEGEYSTQPWTGSSKYSIRFPSSGHSSSLDLEQTHDDGNNQANAQIFGRMRQKHAWPATLSQLAHQVGALAEI